MPFHARELRAHLGERKHRAYDRLRSNRGLASGENGVRGDRFGSDAVRDEAGGTSAQGPTQCMIFPSGAPLDSAIWPGILPVGDTRLSTWGPALDKTGVICALPAANGCDLFTYRQILTVTFPPKHMGYIATLSALLVTLAACSSMRSDYVKKPSTALAPAAVTPRAKNIAAQASDHPSESGFRLLTQSENALMSRIALADHAQRSIDLQYYIFNNDATGRLVMQHLVAAADRGVRIRLLIDDINLRDEIDVLNGLNKHPNIKVRLFNPFKTRDPSFLSKALQFAMDARRLNRRMHNKSFIVDNNVAVVGGRNIGDGYFSVSKDLHFRDLDLIAIGPVVQEASDAFDAYWNCDAAYPVTAFKGKRATHYDLAKLRVDLTHDARTFAQSDYAQAALDKLPDGPSADRPGAWMWGAAELVADDPQKVTEESSSAALRIGPQVKEMVAQAQQSVLLISPYFVPGEQGTQYIADIARRHISVKVLTNSLASTDEPAVHVGYARYRRELLASGVQVFELRPAPHAKQETTARGRSSGVSLHAKAIVVDQQQVFIGSMNLDQRSKNLNTEMGIIVQCPALAAAVTQFFDKATQPKNAYAVTLIGHDNLHSGSMQWTASDGDKTETFHHDPDVTLKRRLEVLVLKFLPIEGML